MAFLPAVGEKEENGLMDGEISCIIVDSTRRGKRMPDALSKTIPVWCTVINRLLFQERLESHVLRTPPEAVGTSEYAQMESRIDGFVEETMVNQAAAP